MSELRRTALHAWHERHGGRMVDFAGWHLPIQYSGVVEEHVAVRERAGLFDVSHMGEVRISGADALALVQRLTVNDAAQLANGQAHYSSMVTPEGGMIDDLLVYRVAADEYLLVVNGATTAKDVAWMQRHAAGDVTIVDESDQWAMVALQGPAAPAILARVVDCDLDAIRYYHFAATSYGGDNAIVSRTGYTGEDGFEVYLPPTRVEALADALLEAGQADGLVPTGLGARDTLRLEAGMLLYGNDMDESRSPIEAGVGWIVKPDKGDFIGRDVLAAQKRDGVDERLVGLRTTGRGIPRHDYPILDAAGARIGVVTSGTFSPTLKEGIGLGYVRAEHAAPDTEIGVEIRGRAVAATVVKPPFYRRQR